MVNFTTLFFAYFAQWQRLITDKFIEALIIVLLLLCIAGLPSIIGLLTLLAVILYAWIIPLFT